MGNIKDAYNNLEGAKIVKIREITKKEIMAEGWEDLMGGDGCRILELDNGIKLYAGRDYEGNGPGALFFYDKDGQYAI